jgi:hypothetical protein
MTFSLKRGQDLSLSKPSYLPAQGKGPRERKKASPILFLPASRVFTPPRRISLGTEVRSCQTMANLRGGIHNCVSISISQEARERSKDIL